MPPSSVAANPRAKPRNPSPARGEVIMLRLGLTGGIATGKSAVAAMLRELRFDVLDADSLARQLIEPSQPAYHEVLREFGTSILDSMSWRARESASRTSK